MSPVGALGGAGNGEHEHEDHHARHRAGATVPVGTGREQQQPGEVDGGEDQHANPGKRGAEDLPQVTEEEVAPRHQRHDGEQRQDGHRAGARHSSQPQADGGGQRQQDERQEQAGESSGEARPYGLQASAVITGQDLVEQGGEGRKAGADEDPGHGRGYHVATGSHPAPRRPVSYHLQVLDRYLQVLIAAPRGVDDRC